MSLSSLEMLKMLADMDRRQRERNRQDSVICGHCGQPLAGFGHAGEPLCHPNDPRAMDCYTLVTVCRHPMSCDCVEKT